MMMTQYWHGACVNTEPIAPCCAFVERLGNGDGPFSVFAVIKMAASDSKAPLRTVKRVQFGILSPDEIVRKKS